MFYTENPSDTRQIFFQSWNKYRANKPLTPLEKQIVAVIHVHPEYHSLLEHESALLAFVAEEGKPNPFLHLGLHLAIRDQISMDRPQGIALLYQRLHAHFALDSLQTEHFIMEHLAQCLWQATQDQSLPNYETYLERLQTAVDSL